jgi:hypothetical protein
MDTPKAKARIAGRANALAALALGAVLVLFVALGSAPAREQEAMEAELARAEAEREAQEEEFMRDVWPTLGEADLPYTVFAAGVLEHAGKEEGDEQTDDSDSSGAPKAPRKDCPDPTYAPQSTSWKDLPPAVVASSSDNCVGYCFRAFIDSVTKKAPRVVRVAIIQEKRSLARATLNRTSRAEWSYLASYEGRPLRFACFEKSDGKGGVPHFDDCAQMESGPPDDWYCLTGARRAEAR